MVRIILTEAAAPDRPQNSIEREYLLHLQAIQQTESMPAWIFSKYSANMTQDMLIAMRQCFPRGFIPLWSAFEETPSFWSQKWPENPNYLQIYRTAFVRIFLNPLVGTYLNHAGLLPY